MKRYIYPANGDKDGVQKNEPPGKNLQSVQPPLQLAEKMGKGMGGSTVLQ